MIKTDPVKFIAELRPGANQCEIAYGVPAGFTIAQGALESAWGTSELSIAANNIFGIKADKSWGGDTIAMDTKEHINGKDVIVRAYWRKYPNWIQCLLDRGKFFHANPRYKAALAYPNDARKFAFEIAKAGYATDPSYYNKLIATMESHNL